MNTAPSITQLEMTEKDIEFAERIAHAKGYTQHTYTSTSGLWGLFLMRDSASDPKPSGCIIKTEEFGFLFVADLEDLQLHELNDEARKEANA